MAKKKKGKAAQRQHYQPAAYLGRFSLDQSKRLRERQLWVRDRRAPRPFQSSAENVGWVTGLYDIDDDSVAGSRSLDSAWSYESSLPGALHALTDRTTMLDGRVWIMTLVPFVAGLFVRGQHWHEEFAKRPLIAQLLRLGVTRPLTSNAAAQRLVEFQEMLAVVMASRWTVLHFSEGVNLVTSDMAVAPAFTPLGPGYVIPIDICTALVVTRTTNREILTWAGDRWVAAVDHYTDEDFEAASQRRAIGAFAKYAVYGPTQDSVEDASVDLAVVPEIGLGLLEGPETADLVCHLYDYFRLLTALDATPTSCQAEADRVNWSVVSRSWTAPIVVELSFPERTGGGVRAHSAGITMDLSYGIEMRKARREAGDFRTGGRVIIPLKDLVERPEMELPGGLPLIGQGRRFSVEEALQRNVVSLGPPLDP